MFRKRFLAIAELDKESSRRIDNFILELRSKGFLGSLSHTIPSHIHITSFPTNDIESVIARLHKTATENYSFDVEYGGIGMRNNTLFLLPSFNRGLLELHDSIALKEDTDWIPGTPVLITDPDEIFLAMPILYNSFRESCLTRENRKFCAHIDTISIYETNPTLLIDRARLMEKTPKDD